MEYDENNELVQCPYDSNHQILKSRLPLHLLRCSQNHKDSTLVPCPFNSSHILEESELEAHILECKSGAKHHIDENVEPITPAPPRPILEDTETWDNEPPVPPYDPDEYCKNNLIIRNLQGAQPAARRQFRESERLRMLDLVDNNKKEKNKEL